MNKETEDRFASNADRRRETQQDRIACIRRMDHWMETMPTIGGWGEDEFVNTAEHVLEDLLGSDLEVCEECRELKGGCERVIVLEGHEAPDSVTTAGTGPREAARTAALKAILEHAAALLSNADGLAEEIACCVEQRCENEDDQDPDAIASRVSSRYRGRLMEGADNAIGAASLAWAGHGRDPDRPGCFRG